MRPKCERTGRYSPLESPTATRQPAKCWLEDPPIEEAVVIDVPIEPATVKGGTSDEESARAEGLPAPAVGIDLVDLDEVEASIDRFGDRYLQRVFSPKEAAGCKGTPRLRSRRLAECFAAKEATRKALGVGDDGLSWPSIALLEDVDGARSLDLSGRAAALASERGITSLAVSVTYAGRLVLALVVASTDRQLAVAP